MAVFIEPSEYPLTSVGKLKAEQSFLEMVVYIESFFYLDNVREQVRWLGPEILDLCSPAYLARAYTASKAVTVAMQRVELIESEISSRAN